MSSFMSLASILIVLVLLSGCGSGEPVTPLDVTTPDPEGVPRIRVGATKNALEKIPEPSENPENSRR